MNEEAGPLAAESAWLPGFAGWAAERGRASPTDALAEARLCLLDTLGCIEAGWNAPQTQTLARALTRAAVGPDGSGAASWRELPPAQAALLTGTAAHAQDFDDYELAASTHPSAVLVPALLAAAELAKPSFGAFLEAYLTGYALITRCGETLGYTHYERGWHATGTLGGLGAAAACGRLLSLDAAALAAAVSLTTSMTAGLKLQFGWQAKALHAGLAARAGLEAAVLAEAGLQGNPAILEGAGGFLDVYGGVESKTGFADWQDFGADAMRRNPVARKPWPSCGYTQRAIEAACKLAEQLKEDRFAVASGTIRIARPYASVVADRNPQTADAARFSLTYCVACALLDGAVTPRSFESEQLHRDDVRTLMSRLTIDAYDPGPEIGDVSPDHPDSVALVLEDGRRAEVTVAHVLGGGTRPMGRAEVREKYLACGGTAEIADLALDAGGDRPIVTGDLLRLGPA